MRGWVSYWAVLSEAHFVAGEYGRALEVAQRGRTYHPDRMQLFWYELTALAGLGRIDEIFTLLEDSLSSAFPGENHGRMLWHVGTVLDLFGFSTDANRVWERSVQWAESVLAVYPESALAHGEMGYALFLLGHLEEAEEHLQRSASLDPAAMPLNPVGALGAVAAKRGDHAEARRVMGWLDAQEAHSRSWALVFWKAQIAEGLGERDEALGYLREAYRGTYPYPASLLMAQRTQLLPSLRGYPPYEELMWPMGRPRR
jgi:tetratricopeptide (TPR) repeat protein